jgi:hypothetical protein
MAKRDYSWFYQTAPDGLLMSASQYKLWSACQARWGYRYLHHIREEQADSASKGTDLHEELELWVKLKRMPKSKAALKAMRFSPAPGMAHAEAPIFYGIGDAHFVGFIDLVYNWEGALERGKGRVLPLGPDGHTVIHDWKFTSSLNNAMSEDALRVDDAANMYAFEAFMGGAGRVSCRWVYVTFDGVSSREVWVEMDREAVATHMAKTAVNTEAAGAAVRAFKKKQLTVLDLVKDPTHCFDYRRLCPYQNIAVDIAADRGCESCKPLSRIKMPAPPGDSPVSADFLNHLDTFPAAGGETKASPPPPKKTAPPPPVKKAAPPPPPKKAKDAVDTDTLTDEEARDLVRDQLKAQGKDPSFADAPGPVVEKGVVNSPRYAPETPAASPEQAKQMQGDSPVEVKEERVPDELDAMDKDQLKALALFEGAITEKQRPRVDNLRQMIRANRIKLAALAEAGKTEPLVEEEEEMPETPVVIDDIAVTPEAAVEILADRVEAVNGMVTHMVDTMKPVILELNQIVDRANEHLYETHDKKPREWGFIPFEGPAALCTAVFDLFTGNKIAAHVVVYNSRCREGMVLETTLKSLARQLRFTLIDGDIA